MMNRRRPHFLEVFLPSSSSQKLSIPTKFVKHLGSQTFGSFSLTGPSGNMWSVKLIEHNDDLLLDDGWPIFVKDHSLGCGDSLVFRYDGHSHFTVQIFDQSSCEKEEAFHAKCSQELSYSCGNLGQKRERDSGVAFPNVYAEQKTRGSWIPVHIDFPDGNKEMKLEMRSSKGLERREIIVNGQDNRTKEFVSKSAKPLPLAIPSFANGQPIPTVVNSRSKKNASTNKTCAKKKKIGTDKKAGISKFIERRAAQYFTSNFPYFVRVMKYSNVSDTGTLVSSLSISSDLFEVTYHMQSCGILLIDGDGSMEHYHEPHGSPRGPRKRPKVKEKEHNMSNQLSVLPGQTFSHEPGVVKLMEDDPGGIISCTTHPLKTQVASFPTRPVSAHLDFIWSSKQPQN